MGRKLRHLPAIGFFVPPLHLRKPPRSGFAQAVEVYCAPLSKKLKSADLLSTASVAP